MTLVGVMAAAGGPVVFQSPAGAAVVSTGVVGGFEAEGNHAVDTTGNIDWATATVVTASDESPDKGFSEGSKEELTAGWTCVSGGVAPPKDDLVRAYVSVRVSDAGSYVDLAWVRAQGNGDVNVLFELNQADDDMSDCAITRTTGDLLVDYDFTGQGAQVTADIVVRRWNGTAFVDLVLPEGSVKAGTNEGAITDAVVGGSLASREFGEVSINLGAILPTAVGCPGFGAINVRSRPSRSVTSALKDYLPTQDIDLSTCGTITLNKVDEAGNPLEGVVFGLFDNSAATGDPIDTCTTGSDGVCQFDDVTPGTYWVKETQGLVGYGTDPDIVEVTVGVGGDVSIETDFVNPRLRGDLTVAKAVVSGEGGEEFTFDIDCDGTAHDSSVTLGDGDEHTVTGIPTGTTCTVTERAIDEDREGHSWTTTVTDSDDSDNGVVVIDTDGERVDFENELTIVLESTTTTQPTTTTVTEATVLGVQIQRQELPRTGVDTGQLVQLGGLALLLGGGLVLVADRRRTAWEQC